MGPMEWILISGCFILQERFSRGFLKNHRFLAGTMRETGTEPPGHRRQSFWNLAV
jgi:hypothetical protein